MQQIAKAGGRDGALRSAVAVRVELVKPGITLFLVLVAGVGYLLAAPAISTGADLVRLGVLLLAVGATVGGAAALNLVREAPLDARMRRTRDRPLPSGRLGRREGLAIAVGLTGTGLGLSALLLPWTTTLLLALGHAGYILVYTPLKRVTPLCTPIGALPGALPALAGCAAAGPLGPTAWSFYGAVVLWQIPHFLAIGWLAREDYRRAGFRVLPAIDEDGRRTGAWSVASALLLLPVSLAPVVGDATSVADIGWAGGAVAALVVLLGLAYLHRSVAFTRRATDDDARRLFLLSLAWIPAYLVLLLLAELPWPA